MAATTLPNRGLKAPADGDTGVANVLNENWFKLSIMLGAGMPVVSRALTAPPVSPANGAAYIPATGATGAWSAHVGKIVVWDATASGWVPYAPLKGWTCVVTNEGTYGTLIAYSGTAWSTGVALV